MTIQTEMVEIKGQYGDFQGYLALPAEGVGPGVIVLQEIFGINNHIKDVTERFAKEGYTALAPDMFWPLRPGYTAGYTPEDIAEARELKMALDLDRAIDDIGSAMETLAGRKECQGVKQDKGIGVVGFCFGGLMTFLAATRQKPGCVSAYYGAGTGSKMEEAPNLVCPIQFHLGGLDKSIPASEVEQIKEAVAPIPQAEVFVYPEADHGFHCDQRSQYHPPSAAIAWERTLKLFKENL